MSYKRLSNYIESFSLYSAIRGGSRVFSPKDQCWCQTTSSGVSLTNDKGINGNVGNCYPEQLCGNCNLNFSGNCPQVGNISSSQLLNYNKTEWNNYNKQEINKFDPRVLIGYYCPNPFIRVGPKSDGGYIVVDGFNYDHFLSCGIADDIRFEVALLDKYPHLKCDAFDGTINTCPKHKNINWVNKNIGHINSAKTTNLKPYIRNYKNIFLKMDIEGSEFNWIDSMSLENLNCFSQIVMEIHWPFDNYRCKILKKLNQTHYVTHIHGNNYSGTLIINHSNYPTIKLPEVFEITYVRKNNFLKKLNKIGKKYPTPLDSPNNPNEQDIGFTISL